MRFSNDSLQLHGVLNGDPMSAAVTFRCLQSLSHNEGLSIIGPDTGAPYNEVRFVGECKPEISGSVAALASLLDTLSILGANCMTADGSHPGVRAFMQAHNACAPDARAEGAAHQRITVAKSHIVISQISGQRGQTAYATVRVIQESVDGQAHPEVVVYNAELPTEFILDEEFVICEPTIGGIQIAGDHISSWTFDSGITITPIIAAGSIYVTAVDITKIAPRITVQHDDASLLDDAKIPATGLRCTLSDTFFPLQKRDPFGGLIDRGESEHILLSAAGYAYHSRRYEASGSAVGTGEITIECTADESEGVPLAVETGVAIDGST